MTLTGHWNRIEERTHDLKSRNDLKREKQKWQQRRELYHHKVDAYILNGGSINRSHQWAFEFIVRQSLTEIQDMIDMMDILQGKTPEPRHILTQRL